MKHSCLQHVGELMNDNQNSIELPGNPIPAARPRVTRFKNTYDPKFKEKQIAKALIKKQWKAPPLNCPLHMDMSFQMSLPKSWSGKKKIENRGKPHIIKPDLDNLEKFALDALSGIVVEDDSCIFSIKSEKKYSETPKTIIKVIKLE